MVFVEEKYVFVTHPTCSRDQGIAEVESNLERRGKFTILLVLQSGVNCEQAEWEFVSYVGINRKPQTSTPIDWRLFPWRITTVDALLIP